MEGSALLGGEKASPDAINPLRDEAEEGSRSEESEDDDIAGVRSSGATDKGSESGGRARFATSDGPTRPNLEGRHPGGGMSSPFPAIIEVGSEVDNCCGGLLPSTSPEQHLSLEDPSRLSPGMAAEQSCFYESESTSLPAEYIPSPESQASSPSNRADQPSPFPRGRRSTLTSSTDPAEHRRQALSPDPSTLYADGDGGRDLQSDGKLPSLLNPDGTLQARPSPLEPHEGRPQAGYRHPMSFLPHIIPARTSDGHNAYIQSSVPIAPSWPIKQALKAQVH